METKNVWALVNWGVLLLVTLAAAWMIWGFPQDTGGRDSAVFIPVEQCVDVEAIEDISYEACYDAPSEMIFFKMKRGNVNYQINKATVSFVGLTSQSYDFSNLPAVGSNSAYKFFSKKNPGSLNVELDVVQVSSELFCASNGVFVDYCPTGIAGAAAGVFINSIGGISFGDFVEIQKFPDFSDVDSNVVFLDLIDKERVWESRCKSDWDCGEWEACENGVQRRNCSDVESCLVPTNSPVRMQQCAEPCAEKWVCEWSPCENGVSVPDCNDVNECGTSFNIPKKLPCGEKTGCVPDVVCEAWTDCSVDYDFLDLEKANGISELTGSKTRVCADKEGCVPVEIEEEACSVNVDVYTKKFEKCGEEYVGIYNALDDSALAILKDGFEKDNSLNIYFGGQEGVYCDYCFDGILNGDEDDVDCGGSCKDCSDKYKQVILKKSLWERFTDWLS